MKNEHGQEVTELGNFIDVQRQDVNGIPVAAQLVSCNTIEIQAVTNTPQGGDAGHGGFTTITFLDIGGTAWGVEVNGDRKEQPESIVIELLGDTEASTMADALEFAAKSLRAQMAANQKKNPTPS